MKTILYGHAWMSGALTAFAFGGFLRAFNATPQVWVWACVVGIGLMWTVLGFAYAARRDAESGDGDQLGRAWRTSSTSPEIRRTRTSTPTARATTSARRRSSSTSEEVTISGAS